jgi:hypothetical protein
MAVPKEHIREIVTAFMMLHPATADAAKNHHPNPGDTNHPKRKDITPMPANPDSTPED